MNASGQAALAARLEAKAVALSRRCVEAMYRDPFWDRRFGERGRRHAEADSRHHVQYAVSALRADDIGIFRHYARWLRGVLAVRGMCSWHLAESFRQLALALAAESIAGAEGAVAVLDEGARALRYVDGPAGALAHAADAIRADVQAAVPLAAPYRLDELMSFLADSVALDHRTGFAAHVAFLEATLAADNPEREALARTLTALQHTARARLGPAQWAAVEGAPVPAENDTPP